MSEELEQRQRDFSERETKSKAEAGLAVEKVHALETEIETLKETSITWRQECDMAKESLEAMRLEKDTVIDSLKADVSAHETGAKIQAMMKAMSVKDQELSTLRQQLSGAEHEVADQGVEVKKLREETAAARLRFIELRDVLNDTKSQRDADEMRLDEMAKNVGHHNKKQKIHFIELLQRDRRKLKLTNQKLSAEVAELRLKKYA